MNFAVFLNSSDVLSLKLSLHLIFSIRILRSRFVSRNKNVHSEVNSVFNYNALTKNKKYKRFREANLKILVIKFNNLSL